MKHEKEIKTIVSFLKQRTIIIFVGGFIVFYLFGKWDLGVSVGAGFILAMMDKYWILGDNPLHQKGRE